MRMQPEYSSRYRSNHVRCGKKFCMNHVVVMVTVVVVVVVEVEEEEGEGEEKSSAPNPY